MPVWLQVTVYSSAASGKRRYRFAAKDITSLKKKRMGKRMANSPGCLLNYWTNSNGNHCSSNDETESCATCMLQETTPVDCH